MFNVHGVCRRAYFIAYLSYACVRFFIYMLHVIGSCLVCLLRVANDCSSLVVGWRREFDVASWIGS